MYSAKEHCAVYQAGWLILNQTARQGHCGGYELLWLPLLYEISEQLNSDLSPKNYVTPGI